MVKVQKINIRSNITLFYTFVKPFFRTYTLESTTRSHFELGTHTYKFFFKLPTK